MKCNVLITLSQCIIFNWFLIIQRPKFGLCVPQFAHCSCLWVLQHTCQNLYQSRPSEGRCTGEGNGGEKKISPIKKPSTLGKRAWFKAIFLEINPLFRLSNDENRFYEKFSFPGYNGVMRKRNYKQQPRFMGGKIRAEILGECILDSVCLSF